MQIATAAQMRECDRQAIASGIPSLQLMEQAASALAVQVLIHVQEKKGKKAKKGVRVAVFCGTGNNGGDGVAAARLLALAGLEVRAILVGNREKMTEDCHAMATRLEDETDVSLEPFSSLNEEFQAWLKSAAILVDALFGIGLTRPVEGDYASAIHQMNHSGLPIFSADIPSGIETDSGRVLGVAVHAFATVTFTCAKIGHFLREGAACTGKLTVASIGIPDHFVKSQTEINPIGALFPKEIALPRRDRNAHKGNFGRVCILGGSVGLTGAPIFAAQAAVRAGAGLVTVLVPSSIWPIAAVKLQSAMPVPVPAGEDGSLSLQAWPDIQKRIASSDVVLVGPGLGRSEETTSVIREVLIQTEKPLILDADGINALETHIDVLDARRGKRTILTPHDGEFARLTGALPGEDRVETARNFAVKHGCVLVLKGHRTVTAFPDGKTWINPTGNPGMAKGGSGDVLAGMIAACIGQNLPDAVSTAVCLHGWAGDLAAADLGEYGMTPSDLVDRIPLVMQEKDV